MTKKTGTASDPWTSCSPDKKPLDDWELTNARTDGVSPFKQILFNSIGDSSNMSAIGRVSCIHTTENFDRPSDLKDELGRQKVPDIGEQANEGPWDEEFFTVLEIMLKELVHSIKTKN